ncbi:MAG: hypothetical protein HY567_04655 [Candidatus Kerfeldbacteria bacterium]|nr:hypothetical protein [Candidatus Kerfeldbacteria bacterium]
MDFCPRCRADQPLFGIGWCLECGLTLIPVWGGFNPISPFAGITVQAPKLFDLPDGFYNEDFPDYWPEDGNPSPGLTVTAEEIDTLIRESLSPRH